MIENVTSSGNSTSERRNEMARIIHSNERTWSSSTGLRVLMTCAAAIVVVGGCGPGGPGGQPCKLTAVSPAPNLQFDTNPFSGLNRPDSAIAVGPNHIVTAV